MYVRFPAMSTDEKLATLTPIGWSQVSLSPDEALGILAPDNYPLEFWLEMWGGEPVYRIVDWDDVDRAVSAIDGREIRDVMPERALQVVQHNLSAPAASLDRSYLRSDQWTVTGYWDELRPFHVIALNDPRDTHYYVAIDTGEIVLDTARWERFWNYLGAIPHWIYFEFIRFDTDKWFWLIIVVSGIGIVSATSGLWLGISRLRLRKRYGGVNVTPFRGWMKWHHITGILGGVFLFAWIVTGLLTMYPGGFLEQREVTRAELEQYAGNTRPQFNLAGRDGLIAAGATAKTAHFIWLAGRPLIILNQGAHDALIADGLTGSFEAISDNDLYVAAQLLMPESKLVLAERIIDGDEYWHTGFTVKKLPVLRIGFDDEANTWFHIDPASGQVIGILDDVGRLDRWVNSGVHNIDLAFLFKNRPLWDIIVWILMLAGLFVSVSALVIGTKRLSFTVSSAKRRRAIANRSSDTSKEIMT